MASPEVVDKSLVDLINKALSARSPQEGRREALRQRRKDWAEFIAVADRLLEQHGIPDPENPDTIQTPPIKVIDMEVYVARETETSQPGNEPVNKDIYTAILASHEGSKPIHLFSTDQYVPLVDYVRSNTNTRARNQFGRVASNEEIAQGLQAIKIIEASLATPQQ